MGTFPITKIATSFSLILINILATEITLNYLYRRFSKPMRTNDVPSY